jgi:hypothetical protein
MRTVAVVQCGNFTQNIIGFLLVPDHLDLFQERMKWRKTDPEKRLQSHWEYPDDYLQFLLKIPGVSRANVEVHEI